MIETLIQALVAIHMTPDVIELADALWLNAFMDEEPEETNQLMAESPPDNAPDQPPPKSEPDRAPEEAPAPTSPKWPSDGNSLPSSSVLQAGDIVTDSVERRPTVKGLRATPFYSGGATALPGALEIARTLRPLLRRVPTAASLVLDEAATVEQMAAHPFYRHLWTPVMEPASERWLDLVLVIDHWGSMAIWQSTIDEFYQLLTQLGAFRNIYTYRLEVAEAPTHNWATSKPVLRAATASQRLCQPKELVDPANRRLILLLSDCISPIWRNGSIKELLTAWANCTMVTLLQMLPAHQWPNTALKRALPVDLYAISPGLTNNQLDQVLPWYLVDDEISPAVPLPIITLEPKALKSWARMIAGLGHDLVPGVLITGEATPVAEESGHSAQERLATFQRSASPLARELAGYLAAAPLTLPVMRLVQRTMLPHSRQTHLAEFFLSGLIKRVGPANPDAHPNTIHYDFVDKALRNQLLATVGRSSSKRVLEKVSAYIADRNHQIHRFHAWIANPEGEEEFTIEAETLPFAQVAVTVLKRLGSRYHALAELLERQIDNLKYVTDRRKDSLPVTSQQASLSLSSIHLESRFGSVLRVVVAIDFGTTRSGYAYAFLGTDPNPHIYERISWPDMPFKTPKTLTHLLYDYVGTPVAWGASARRRLAELMREGTGKEYIFIQNFKMDLRESKTPDGPVTQRGNRTFRTENLIADYLKYLKDMALADLAGTIGSTLNVEDILWCLTVPAIWTEAEKQVMRGAAQKAGLISPLASDADRLIFALEPEAAALHCAKRALVELNTGARFMVVDCGEGTVDITTFEVLPDGKYKALTSATGGPHGSIYVDQQFLKYLREKTSIDAITKFQTMEPVSYIRLLDEWATIKYQFDPERSTSTTRFEFPNRLQKLLETDYPAVLKALLDKQSDNQGLDIPHNEMLQFFEPSLRGVESALQQQLKQLEKDNLRCDYIFLVGGFSAALVVQQRIKAKFGNRVKDIIVAEDPEGTIVKGAVYLAYERLLRKPVKSETIKKDPQLTGHDGAVRSAVFSPGSKQIASVGVDGRLLLWDAETKTVRSAISADELLKDKGTIFDLWSVAYAPDGNWLLVTGARGAVLCQTDSYGSVDREHIYKLTDLSGAVWSGKFSSDSTKFLTVSQNGSVCIWRVRDLQRIATTSPLHGANFATFSPDDRAIVVASNDGTATYWSIYDLEEGPSYEHANAAVNYVAFSSRGVLGTASSDHTAKLWGKAPITLRGHTAAVNSIAFRPDGNFVVTASQDGTVRLWSVATGTQIAVLAQHKGHVFTATFSPNGQHIVTAGEDGQVIVWDVSNQIQKARMVEKLPDVVQYDAAIQHPNLFLRSVQLRSATVDTNPNGAPRNWTGNFACIFKLTDRENNEWAIRCFHKSAPDRDIRYKAICKHLVNHPSRFWCTIDYLENEILVDGKRYPIIKMPWVAGDLLGNYVAKNYNNRAVLMLLTNEFRALIDELAKNEIAHGDLAHDNIIVHNNQLVLVDYDSMWVPELAGMASAEVGYPNFQHPQRTDVDFDSTLDRFSAIVIYLALQALMEKPDLWERYGPEAQGESAVEGLLLQRKDFQRPQQSPLLAELEAIPRLQPLVKSFRKICQDPMSNVPQLRDFLISDPASTSFFTRTYIQVTGGVIANESALFIARRIGEELVKRGQVLLTYGTQGIDVAVASGAYDTCQRNNLEPAEFIKIFRPNQAPDAQFSHGDFRVIGSTWDECREYVAKMSTVVVVLSGSYGTDKVASVAQEYNVPIIPIGYTEGIAKDLWRFKYQSLAKRLNIDIAVLEQIGPAQTDPDNLLNALFLILDKIHPDNTEQHARYNLLLDNFNDSKSISELNESDPQKKWDILRSLIKQRFIEHKNQLEELLRNLVGYALRNTSRSSFGVRGDIQGEGVSVGDVSDIDRIQFFWDSMDDEEIGRGSLLFSCECIAEIEALVYWTENNVLGPDDKSLRNYGGSEPLLYNVTGTSNVKVYGILLIEFPLQLPTDNRMITPSSMEIYEITDIQVIKNSLSYDLL